MMLRPAPLLIICARTNMIATTFSCPSDNASECPPDNRPSKVSWEKRHPTLTVEMIKL